MTVVGLDCGSQYTKGVLMRDGKVVAKAIASTEFDANQAALDVLHTLMRDAGITNQSEIQTVAVIGSGADMVEFKTKEVTGSSAAAKGCRYYFPMADVVLDIGAEGSRAVKLDRDGKVFSYVNNDKCASGSGTFIENMARVLNVPIEEMGALSLRHTKEVPMNVQCSVFVESEVISMVHNNESAENIAYSVHAGVANRMISMLRRLGAGARYAVIGGPGLNPGLIQCLEQGLNCKVDISPEYTAYIGATGAALCG